MRLRCANRTYGSKGGLHIGFKADRVGNAVLFPARGEADGFPTAAPLPVRTAHPMWRHPMTDYLFPPPATPSLPIRDSQQRFPIHRIFCVGRNYEVRG